MKKLIFAVLMLFSGYAAADRVDILESWDTAQYCMQTTEFYHAGADGNKSGYPRLIKTMPASFIELLEHHKPLPRDAMWAMQWDQLTPREQEFQGKIVYLGWDDVEALKAHKEVTDDDVSKITNIYFQNCAQDRAKQKVAPKLKVESGTGVGSPSTKVDLYPSTYCHEGVTKIASSEKIAKPNVMECDELIQDTDIIIGAIQEGIGEDQLVEFAQSSKELSPERLERVIAQIKMAYHWDGDLQEWKERVTQGCN